MSTTDLERLAPILALTEIPGIRAKVVIEALNAFQVDSSTAFLDVVLGAGATARKGIVEIVAVPLEVVQVQWRIRRNKRGR